MRPLALIAALTPSRVIGANGQLPWSLPEDLRHFKAQTMGHAIIMGRATHESIGRALPGRRNIVLSRRPHVTFAGCEVATSLEEALTLARTTDAEPFVIGGASVYAEALPRATRLLLTCLLLDVPGDAYFPAWAAAEWREVNTRPGEGVVFREFTRFSPAIKAPVAG